MAYRNIQALDLTGQQFSKWTALRRSSERKWTCRCACGNERDVDLYSLHKGDSTSCGHCGTWSANSRTHGMTGTSEYNTWWAMHARVNNPNSSFYPYYGGRGITICERWAKFENFYADMGRKPSAEHSLNRIDNDQGYSPDNCEWSTNREQSRNKRSNKLLTWNGRTQCVTDWSREIGGGSTGLQGRLRKGWTVERAMTTPFR